MNATLALIEVNIIGGVQNFISGITNTLNIGINNISSLVGSIINALSTQITQGFQNLLNIFSSLSQTIAADVGAVITTAINDAINAAGFVSQFVTGIVTAISNAFDTYIVTPLKAFIQPIFDSLARAETTLEFIFEQFAANPFAFIENMITQVINTLNNIGQVTVGGLTPLIQAIQTFAQQLAAIPAQVDAAISAALGSISSTVDAGYARLYNAVFEYLVPSFINTLQSATASILAAIAAIPTLAQNGINDLANAVAQIEHDISNLSEYVNSAFNQLATGINTLITSIGQDLAAFADALWMGLDTYIVQPATQAVQGLGSAVYGTLVQWQKDVENSIISLLPKTPQQAFDSATLVLELGIGSFALGEAAAIIADVFHPIKKLGAQEALHKGLELLGISEISSAMYGIIVETGWSKQLEYYFNYALQPNRISEGDAQTAVYYGALTAQQYLTELQYEGYNNDAIQAKLATLYRPVNARLLVTLWEDNLVPDAYIIDQLNKTGFQPSDSAYILQALQYRALKPFEANAKSLIFTYYKDGFMDDATATNIMTQFGTPMAQQNYILALGRYQRQYEQKVLARNYILALVKKGVIQPDEAISDLQALGMDKDTANLVVNVAVTVELPSLSAAEKKAFLATFIPDAQALAGG